MRKYVKIFVLAGIMSTNINASELPCDLHYATALDFMSNGKYVEASQELEQAIRLAPTPTLSNPEYLPYIQLAVASFKAERFSSARQALIQSQIHGFATKSDTGVKLINKYAANIMTAPPSNDVELLPQMSVASFMDVNQGEYIISEENAELIRSAVLRRCAVSSKLDSNKLPWYFHYEYGVDLMEAGDPQRALETLVLGANIREESKRNKRMYGMWFIDYLPYYQIALAHSKLGNWESAYDAIQTSVNFGEFQPGDRDYESFSELDELIKNHMQNNES